MDTVYQSGVDSVYSMAYGGPGQNLRMDEGGEAACWLDRVCEECGRLRARSGPGPCEHCGAATVAGTAGPAGESEDAEAEDGERAEPPGDGAAG
ncbi:hypothetical protein [Kitasatospora sp. NPDC090091]|uniref:hypothetical protein n=1 Tax=Kitasatospora sp. NPDC090091 TaxID=3364081 RepID=UPI0038298F2E